MLVHRIQICSVLHMGPLKEECVDSHGVHLVPTCVPNGRRKGKELSVQPSSLVSRSSNQQGRKVTVVHALHVDS